MFRRIDRSPTLSRMIERLSSLLARQRGLPVVLGIALVIIGFVIQVVNVALNSPLLEIGGLIFNSGGVLVALIGLLLAEPLGK